MVNEESSSYYITIFLGINITVDAQNYVKIYDAETLDPLAFANVKLTETSSNQSTQTISDQFGEIALPYQNETIIEISYIGYEKYRKTIRPGRTALIYVFPLEMKVEEVVVTGNPKESSLKESMYEVSVITKETLDKRAAVNLSDVLMNELNIQINNDGVLGSQVNLQGLGGSNVKIMIDGVPIIGRLDGNLDLSQINMNNIERIEIVEGPISAIYGSNAIAGVINLITKQSQKNKVEAFINGYYESIGTYNLDALIGFKKKNHLIQFTGGRYFFDGWNSTDYDRDVAWNPKEQYFGGINYVYRTKTDWFHKVKANYFQDLIQNRYDPAGAIPIAFDDMYSTKRTDASYSITGNMKENISFNSNNAYNNYKRVKNKYQKDLSTLESILIQDSDSEDNQDTTSANQWMSRTFISYDDQEKFYSIQTGIDFNIENGKGGRFSEEDGSSALIADLAFFTSINFKLGDKVKIQPALRYGYNSQFKTLPTPSLQFKYEINPNLSYRVNYGMGFRAPSLKELYLVFNDANHNIFGNRDLVPEQSQNISSSISYNKKINLHQFKFSNKLFYNYKYNAIALTPDENNRFEYVNIADFTSLGAQFEARYQWRNLSVNYGISYIGISNTSQEDIENKFFFAPQMQTNISYTFQKANLSLSLFNKWNGAKKDYQISGEDSNVELVTIQAYDMLDFTIQKGFWKDRIHLNLGVKNILDVSNINGTSSSGAHNTESQTQIASGRTYFIGIKIGTGQ